MESQPLWGRGEVEDIILCLDRQLTIFFEIADRVPADVASPRLSCSLMEAVKRSGNLAASNGFLKASKDAK